MEENQTTPTAEVANALRAAIQEQPGFTELATENARLVNANSEAATLLRRCVFELNSWMRMYDSDIDSLTLVGDVRHFLKYLK